MLRAKDEELRRALEEKARIVAELRVRYIRDPLCELFCCVRFILCEVRWDGCEQHYYSSKQQQQQQQ